jgi:hypothetical protein
MNIVFNLDWVQLLQLLVAVILPVVVGLVTTRVTAPGRKAILLLTLSVVTSMLAELLYAIQMGVAYDLGAGIVLALTTFIVGVATHYGLWKPTGVSAAVERSGITAA